jgi:hypothetical protein
MADYLETNTPRLRVTQTGPRGTHHMIFRSQPASAPATMISGARAVITAMAQYCWHTTSWALADIAPEGSDVFLPVDWGTPIPGGLDADPNNVEPYGVYLNFIGRSLAGSRVAFYLFNVGRDFMTANNRLTPTEHSGVTVVKAAIDAVENGIVAIDQAPVRMKAYANSGINDRVAKKSRSLV